MNDFSKILYLIENNALHAFRLKFFSAAENLPVLNRKNNPKILILTDISQFITASGKVEFILGQTTHFRKYHDYLPIRVN